MAKEDLVGVEGENLLLGEAALNLDGHHHLLHLAPELAVRVEKQVAGELHGQGAGPLGARSAAQIAIGGAHDAPQVNAPVALKVLVLNGDDGVAQNLRIILIAGNDPPLQGEAPDDRSLVVVKLGDGAGAVALEIGDLRQVGGIDKEQSGESSKHGRRHHGQPEDHTRHHVRALGWRDRLDLRIFDTAHCGSSLIGGVWIAQGYHPGAGWAEPGEPLRPTMGAWSGDSGLHFRAAVSIL